MTNWLIAISDADYRQQLMYDHDSVALPDDAPARAIADGDRVVLAADGFAYALGVIDAGRVRYTHRPDGARAECRTIEVGVHRLDSGEFDRLSKALWGPAEPVRDWLVNVAMPIEARTPAEAVRQFWSHVNRLGPAELPAFVSPYGDELAMQAFVLGAEHEMDPEEED